MPLSLSQQKALEPREVMVIGPFLGLPNPNTIRIIIGLPHLALPEIRCVLSRQGQDRLHVETSKRQHDRFGVYTFDFSGLNPDEEYQYSFESDTLPIDLQGLTTKDCCFRGPGKFHPGDSFILMSCHNPYMPRPGSADDGWSMWKKLHQEVIKDSSIRLLVLGGDQVYNDDVEEKAIPLLEKSLNNNTVEKVRDHFINQYQFYWENPHHRKVLARIPSITMWDDHDITDGWGGRPESFKDKDFLPHWQKYFEIAREAFRAYQASRNPTPITGAPANVFTTTLDIGDSRLYLLDLRTEKNTERHQVWTDMHEQALNAHLNTTPDPIKRTFILSPVVPFRTNFGVDTRLTKWSAFFYKIMQMYERKKTYRKHGWKRHLAYALWLSFAVFLLDLVLGDHTRLFGFLSCLMLIVIGLGVVLNRILERILLRTDVPKLSDDLEDGLSSEINRPTLRRLLATLFDFKRRTGKEVVILSGDIHLAGMTEIVCVHDGNADAIPQVVSSPIAYEPMPKIVEGFTTTTSEMDMGDTGTCRLFARNVFYTSKRNFARIYPSQFTTPQTEAPIHFYLENHQYPLAMRSTFMPLSTLNAS